MLGRGRLEESEYKWGLSGFGIRSLRVPGHGCEGSSGFCCVRLEVLVMESYIGLVSRLLGVGCWA